MYLNRSWRWASAITFALSVAVGSSNAAAIRPADGAQRSMEKLSRGLVAIRTGEKGAYLSWRLLGTDSPAISFDVYRDGVKINAQPITESTNFVDTDGESTSSYSVRASVGDKLLDATAPVTPEPTLFRDIRLEPPAPIELPDGRQPVFRPSDASVGDLDGDGDYELVLQWEGTSLGGYTIRNRFTSPTILEGLELDGTSLWRINLGINVRTGYHYTPFMVYDLDGDGTAEIVVQTSDGTVDGTGKILGDGMKDWRDTGGNVLRAPEQLTVFDGKTGATRATVKYEPTRGRVSSWGDNNGNRSERHLACIAYLDGQYPSVIMARGYYHGRTEIGPGRTAIAAWSFRDGKLALKWKFDTLGRDDLNDYIGQGSHSIAAGDVDGDSKDEILYGAMAIDHDGTALYTTQLGHGDAHHFSDHDPSRPGLEFYMPHEGARPGGSPGVSFRDAGTGKILWSLPVKIRCDVGRAGCADVWAGSPGAESWMSGGESVWGAGGDKKLYSSKGEIVGPAPATSANFFIWWDGDLTREILNSNWIAKYDPKAAGAMRRLLTAEGCTSINGTKATPVLSADLHGDWREEVIWAREDGRALRLFTTVIPTSHRLPTLMHDPVYRLSVAWQNVAYNQPPHPGYTLETLAKRWAARSN